jgi:hypothetical protein
MEPRRTVQLLRIEPNGAYHETYFEGLRDGGRDWPPHGAAAGNGGAVAAGVLGGLAAGAIIGGAVAQPRYYAPAPAYGYEVEPAYAAPRCYMTRGEPVWDAYRGIWVRPRVRVCD